jgi:hypothetical protein
MNQIIVSQVTAGFHLEPSSSGANRSLTGNLLFDCFLKDLESENPKKEIVHKMKVELPRTNATMANLLPLFLTITRQSPKKQKWQRKQWRTILKETK